MVVFGSTMKSVLYTLLYDTDEKKLKETRFLFISTVFASMKRLFRMVKVFFFSFVRLFLFRANVVPQVYLRLFFLKFNVGYKCFSLFFFSLSLQPQINSLTDSIRNHCMLKCYITTYINQQMA